MKKKQKKGSDDPVINLEQQALSQLNSRHFKEATELYKKLWQQEGVNDSKWQQQIAHCYLQRALSFAKRGMVKEALILWDNYIQFAESPYEAYDQYICWVIQVKNQNNLESALESLSAEQLDEQYPELAVLLGLLVFTEYPELQHKLPQDSSFIAHLKIIQTALRAYHDNITEELNDVLRKIPFRSAFRDFRSLLNAVKTSPISMQGLDKVPAKSAYSSVANLLFSSGLNGATLVRELTKFSLEQRRLIIQIKGFNKKQEKFIEYLVKNNDRLSDKVKFNSIIQFKSLCDPGLAQCFCQAMLATYPTGQRDFKKHFAEVNKFEKYRIKALSSERDGDRYDTEHYWRLCIDELDVEDTGNNLKIALILRHIAKRELDPEERTQLLIESLDYDEDITSYLEVLKGLSQYDEDIKDYKLWLKKTIEKFPQNIEVLTQAINVAVQNKTYKKASQYASKILKIDPLNTFAKDILFSSHLAHARRLIKTKKYHLVEQEIKYAENLKLGKNYISQIQLIRGFFCFVDQDKKKGVELIAKTLNDSKIDPVNIHFQVAMETLLTGLPVTTILKVLPSIKGYVLSEQEMLVIVQQLKYYGKDIENQALLHKAIEKIKPALKTALSKQNYNEELLLTLCQTLDKINAFEMLRYCSKLAVDKWEIPIWLYYKLYSEKNGRAEKCSYRDLMHLEHIREQASNDKDNRALVLIDAFINLYHQMHPEQNMGFLEGLLGFENEYEDEIFDSPLEVLFSHLPERVLDKLTEEADEITRKVSPERLLKQLIKKLGSSQHILMAMMQDPDLFTALVLSKAADNLNLDIELSIDEILEAFNVNQKSSPFPF